MLQNSRRQANQRGKTRLGALWKLKKGAHTHTHTHLPTDVGVFMSGTNLFKAEN